MNKENVIQEIKNNLKKLFNFAEQKFNNYTLSDGKNITCDSDELGVGSEVYVLDDQGNQTPLNDGEYVLEDGRTFSIKENKVIDIKGGAIEKEEEVTSTAPEQEMADKPAEGGEPKAEKEEEKKVADDSADLKGRVEDLERQLGEIMDVIKGLQPTQMKINEEFRKKISKIAGEPGDEAVKTSRTGFGTIDSKNIAASQERRAETLKRLQSLKKF